MLKAGTHVGNYTIRKMVGKGGMGEVYQAEHLEIGRLAAVKVLDPELSGFPDAVERFINEARAINRIRHPNIVEVFDFGRTPDGCLYCLMEYLDGSDLMQVIQTRSPMPAAEVLPYLTQIASAIQAAHAQGIIHRDLKPENILVMPGPPLLIKILDFGIAKLLTFGPDSPLTSMGTIMGSPLVMAPEQASGQLSRIGPWTDLYSVGVILYWMLGGLPPFHSEPPAVILAKHIQTPPPPLRLLAPTLTPRIQSLVEACLAKDPEQRPASADALVQAFRAALEASTGDALSETLPVPAPSPSADRPAPGTDRRLALNNSQRITALDATLPGSTEPGRLSALSGEQMAEADPTDRIPRAPRTALFVSLALVVVGAAGLLFLARDQGWGGCGASSLPEPIPSTSPRKGTDSEPAGESAQTNMDPRQSTKTQDIAVRRTADAGRMGDAAPDIKRPARPRGRRPVRPDPNPPAPKRPGPGKLGEGTAEF